MYSLDNFERFIPPHIVSRGRDYYQSGAVIDLEPLDDETWAAIVCGSDEYEVTIDLVGKQIMVTDCDCPYDDTCKHIVATLYKLRAYLEAMPAASDLSQYHEERHLEDLNSRLNDLSKQELVRLIEDYGREDLTFVQYLKHRLQRAQELIGLSDVQYRTVVRNIFRESTVAYEYEYWPVIFRHLALLQDKIEALQQERQWRGVFIMVLESLIQISCSWEDTFLYDDSLSDDLDKHLSWAYPKTLEICKQMALDDRAGVCSWAWDYINENEEDLKTLYDLCPEHGGKDWFFELRSLLKSEAAAIEVIKKSIELEPQSYGKVALIEHLATIYADRGDMSSRSQLYRQYLYIGDIRMKVVQELIEQQQYKQAIELCQEGLKEIDRNAWSSSKNLFQKAELTCWERLHNTKECIRLCRKLFSESNQPLIYYKKLRNLLSQADWEVLRPKLMGSQRLAYDDLVWIYRDEHEYELLFALIDRDPLGLNYLDEGKLLPAQYVERQLQSLQVKVRNLAASQTDRKGYRLVVRLLRYMLSLEGGREVVPPILAEFRTAYRRRPAMLDELSRI